MIGYTPLFSSVVDSSLWEEPLHVRVLFLTMLSVKDWDHVVRVSDHHLRRKANLSSDKELLDGLRILSSPDKRTQIEQPFNGRRIEKVEDGWLILNGEKYQAIMKRINLQSKWARNKREQRARKALEKKNKATRLPDVESAVERAGTQEERDRIMAEAEEARVIHNSAKKPK